MSPAADKTPDTAGAAAGHDAADAAKAAANAASEAADNAAAEVLVCSAKGCREPATVALLWNNPKLHTPQRRKTWAACGAHEESLSRFLAARGFLRETEPLAP